MDREMLREMIEYYRGQGAPQDQQMLIALLREMQEALGGVLSQDMLAEIVQAYAIREAALHALIRRVPSLKYESAPHRLEICGTCAKGAALRAYVERLYGVKSGDICEKAGFSYRVTPCMKNCKNGPSVKWDGQMYSAMTENALRALIEKR